MFNHKTQIMIAILATVGFVGSLQAGASGNDLSTKAKFEPTPEAVPGEYIVKLKPQLSAMNKQLAQAGLRSFIKSQILGQNIVVIKRPVFEAEKSALETLAHNELVEIVEPNFIYRTKRLPNDPKLDLLWGLRNIGQKDSDGQVGIAGIDTQVEKAWDIQTGSRKIIVAVIDTGVDYNHPDLKENMWINEPEQNGTAGVDDDNNGVVDDIYGYNAINNSGNPMDDQGHGSHCAGTIGAKGNDEKGIVGVNWDVRLMGVKFLDANGSGTLENAIKAIDYATKMGAHIQSNSWGGGGFSQTLYEAIVRANEGGALFVAAAGNESNNNDSRPSYPATYQIPNIISVAAIDNRGQKADFSNFGKNTVHIGAPGVNVYSSTGGQYDSWSGTSMATPHVSGVAALVWANEENLTAAEIRSRLLATAKPIAGLRGKSKTGGMVDAFAAITNTAHPPDLEDPNNWPTVELNFASASPYLPKTNQTFDVAVPEGTKEFALFFENFDTEANYDVLKIYDESGKLVDSLSGSLGGVFSQTIKGSRAKLVFTSDESVEKSGWTLTKAAVR
jgi:thermitase